MNTERFEMMMVQYQRLVYSVCYQMVCDEQLAQDLAQDTFLSAWLHLDSCREGNEKAWLCRIAVNKAKDHLKSAAVRRSAVWEPEKMEVLSADTDMQAALESRDAAQRKIMLKIKEKRPAEHHPCALRRFPVRGGNAAPGRGPES